MPNVEYIQVSGNESWPVRDKEAHELITGLNESITGINATLTENNGKFNAINTSLDNMAAAIIPWIEDATYSGCYYRMVGSEKEWLNPPMNVSRYRTFERHKGKPVYVEIRSPGALPVNGQMAIDIIYSATKSVDEIIDIDVKFYNGSTKKLYPFPPANVTINNCFWSVDYAAMTLTTTADLSGVTAYVRTRYTLE